jgi:hypothetical protein
MLRHPLTLETLPHDEYKLLGRLGPDVAWQLHLVYCFTILFHTEFELILVDEEVRQVEELRDELLDVRLLAAPPSLFDRGEQPVRQIKSVYIVIIK